MKWGAFAAFCIAYMVLLGFASWIIQSALPCWGLIPLLILVGIAYDKGD